MISLAQRGEIGGFTLQGGKIELVITDVREKQIMNAKSDKTDNRFTWFTNLATSTAERGRIFYYVRKTRLQREFFG